MKIFEKHSNDQDNFENGIVLLWRSLKNMKSLLHRILKMLKHSNRVEKKIESIFHELSTSGLQLDKKTHLLKDFYNLLSKAKTAQGEARNILLHFKLRENHMIIEEAFNKFHESHKHTREAQKVLKKMTKNNLLK